MQPALESFDALLSDVCADRNGFAVTRLPPGIALETLRSEDGILQQERQQQQRSHRLLRPREVVDLPVRLALEHEQPLRARAQEMGIAAGIRELDPGRAVPGGDVALPVE